MCNEYYEVIEQGIKKLIYRKDFEEYCCDRESKGYDIVWSDFKTNKLFVRRVDEMTQGRLMKKKDMIDQIKRKLRAFGEGGYYFDELADCEESYKCLEKLNTTLLIKISTCLTYLSDYAEELDYRNYGESREKEERVK